MHRRINFDTLIFLTYPSSSSIHNLMFFLKPTYIFLIDPSSWRICNCSNYFLLLEIAVPNMVSCAWLRLGRGGLWLLLLHLLKARRHANQARIRLFHKHNDRSVNQGYNWLDRKHYVRDAESIKTLNARGLRMSNDALGTKFIELAPGKKHRECYNSSSSVRLKRKWQYQYLKINSL